MAYLCGNIIGGCDLGHKVVRRNHEYIQGRDFTITDHFSKETTIKTINELNKELKNILNKKNNNNMNILNCKSYTFYFDYEVKEDSAFVTKYGTIKLIADNMSMAQKMFDKLYLDGDCSSYNKEPKLHVFQVIESTTL